MKTLVTGGAGFIGSHIVQRLLDDGMETLAVISAPTIGPRVEKRAQRRIGLQRMQRQLLLQEVALATLGPGCHTRQEPADGFVARGDEFVHPITFQEREQNPGNGAVVQPINKRAQGRARHHGRAQAQADRAVVFSRRNETEVPDDVLGQLVSRKRGPEDLGKTSGLGVPHVAHIVEQNGMHRSPNARRHAQSERPRLRCLQGLLARAETARRRPPDGAGTTIAVLSYCPAVNFQCRWRRGLVSVE